MQSQLEKAARENHNLSVDYEVQAKIIREKTARLKALPQRVYGSGSGVAIRAPEAHGHENGRPPE